MVHITTFYKFKEIAADQLESLRESIETTADRLEVRGLILLGAEGINATVSGTAEAIVAFKDLIHSHIHTDVMFKDSSTARHPFHDLKVKIRTEIVTLGRPDLIPSHEDAHLSPEDWEKAMHGEDVVVIDTRNTYETKIGKFKNALELGIDEFREFPQKIAALEIPKDKKVLMYCTGGIRCEKAYLEMKEQGFESVYQLKGGILEYLKQFPDQSFEGECFVFDYRVAVDQSLNPSKTFRLCPHCGQPAATPIECAKCGEPALVCDACLEKSEEYKTCSKNCTHHLRIGSRSKRPPLPELKRRGKVD